MNEPNALELFKLAEEEYDETDIAVDIPATEEEAEKLTSRGETGAWVRAWVYIRYPDEAA